MLRLSFGLFVLLVSGSAWSCISFYSQKVKVTVLAKEEDGYKLLLTKARVENKSNKKVGPTLRRVFKEDDGYLLLKVLKEQAKAEKSKYNKVSDATRKFTQEVALFYMQQLKRNQGTISAVLNRQGKASVEREAMKDYDDMLSEIQRHIQNLNGAPDVSKTIDSIFKASSVVEKGLKDAKVSHNYKDNRGNNLGVPDIIKHKITRGVGCDARSYQVAVPRSFLGKPRHEKVGFKPKSTTAD